MAKTETPMDMAYVPSSGRFTWKEETKTLEFISNTVNADKQDRKKRGGKFQDFGSKRNERATPSVASKPYALGRAKQQNLSRSPKPNSTKHAAEHTDVTLEDIKSVALDLLSEQEPIAATFQGIYEAEQFDHFLLQLINFFHWYFEQKHRAEVKNPMYIEPSLSEKAAYEEAGRKMVEAQRTLGQSYCVLLLGLDLNEEHHMRCGSSRVSATYKDRSMYETLYSFCTYVAWIAFRRKDFKSIQVELGRMLRSDTFNPAIRTKYAPDPVIELDEDKEKAERERERKEAQKKLSPAEYRRLYPKRPAIRSIINQRSPALVSILPSPQEEAHWLFRRRRPLSPTTLGTIGKVDPEDEENGTNQNETLKLGIIGEPFENFNSMTLMPLGADNEDEEGGEQDGQDENEDAAADTHGGLAAKMITRIPSPVPKVCETDITRLSDSTNRKTGPSRQAAAASPTTTEALSDDE